MTLSNLAGDVAKKLNRHAPTILTGISIAGLAATTYLFHKAGMQTAKRNIEEEDTRPIRLSYEEMIRLNWMNYLIPTSVGIATVICLVSTNVINAQNQATLMAAYALAERGYANYRDKVAEMLGYENADAIRNEFVKDAATEVRPTKKNLIRDGSMYFDVFSGQIFNSDEDTIRRAMEFSNEKCEEDGWVTLNYFYDRIGARTTQIGEIMGWADGFPLDIVISDVTFEDGTRGFGLDYVRAPRMGYHEV